MAQMAAATAAMNLGARHEESAILGRSDAALDRLKETRPACAGFKFRSGFKQFLSAACATEHAGALFGVERARAGSFGAMLAQDVKLLRREIAPPFLGRFLNREVFALGVFGRFAEQGTDTGHESLHFL